MNEKASYIQELQILGYHQLSINQRLRTINHFLRITKKEIIEIKPNDIANYINHYKDKNLHSSTINAYYRELTHYFVYLEREQFISKNPFNYYQLHLKKEPYKQRIILTQKQIKQLYQVVKNDTELIVLHLCYGCGLRVLELERLEKKDIDLQRKTLTIPKGKNNKYRVIPLSDKINQDFTNYLEKTTSNPFFLINYHRKKYNRTNALQSLKQLAKRAKITQNITLHGLRHSIATHLLENGLSLEQVQEFLGHKTLEATEIYTRINTQQLKL